MKAPDAQLDATTRWWREWQVGAILLVVLCIYFSRLTDLPIRGEESRRAMVAREILWTGDWIIPRQQNQPFLSRPPLGSYPIACMAMILGDTTLLATRLPTAMATLLTTLLIYGYARQFISRTAAMGSALSYASMGQVLQLGQLAETEATFTFLVAASLLVWHWGYTAGWSMYSTWSLAYIFVAMGALAKGPQAPVYFATTIGCYAIYQRQWKLLIAPAHFVGIGVFALVLGAWQIPFAVQLGWPGVKDIWVDDVGLRFVDQTWLTTLQHLVIFPVEIWICLLPASLFLFAFLRPSFWKAIAPHRAWVSFLIIAIAVTFPTCWFVPGAKPRYYMPLYPCFALLTGLVIDELLRDHSRDWLTHIWQAYRRLVLAVSIGAAVAAIAFAIAPELPWPPLRQSLLFAIPFAVLNCVVAWLLWTGRGACNAPNIVRTLLASTAAFGLLYTGLILNVSISRSEQTARAVASAKAKLPPGTQLASFGLIETAFTYHYGEPVACLNLPQTADEVPDGLEYFCFDRSAAVNPTLPFPWTEEAVISCDRWRRDQPQRTVVIGRRLKQDIAERQSLPRRE